MKLHYRLSSGKWIGGALWPASDLAQLLADLIPLAREYDDRIIVTRVDNRGGRRGQEWVVEPTASAFREEVTVTAMSVLARNGVCPSCGHRVAPSDRRRHAEDCDLRADVADTL